MVACSDSRDRIGSLEFKVRGLEIDEFESQLSGLIEGGGCYEGDYSWRPLVFLWEAMLKNSFISSSAMKNKAFEF